MLRAITTSVKNMRLWFDPALMEIKGLNAGNPQLLPKSIIPAETHGPLASSVANSRLIPYRSLPP
jgi:hypothetical protein